MKNKSDYNITKAPNGTLVKAHNMRVFARKSGADRIIHITVIAKNSFISYKKLERFPEVQMLTIGLKPETQMALYLALKSELGFDKPKT